MSPHFIDSTQCHPAERINSAFHPSLKIMQ